MHPRELLIRDWEELREVRLRALRESGSSYISSFERESGYEENDWKEEFSRGRWWVLSGQGGSPAGLIGATPFQGDWYLEYLWIAPAFRRRGLAARLVRHVIDSVTAEEGISTVALWVLNENQAAYTLYKRLGFIADGTVQELRDGTGRKEIRMRLVVPSGDG